MFKTLSAALIAASMLIAPIAANAAQPAAAPATTTRVEMVKKTHVTPWHHTRTKFVKQRATSRRSRSSSPTTARS